MSKRILITGITGFVGSHMADYLIQNKNKIFGIKRYHLSRLDKVQHIYDKINWYDPIYFNVFSLELILIAFNKFSELY